MSNIYKMLLHERIICDTSTDVTRIDIVRVAGGWLYYTHSILSNTTNLIFVPFNNEFQEVQDV